MLKQRILSGLFLAAIIVTILLLSGFPMIIKAASVLLSALAAWELCRTGDFLKNKAFTFGCVAMASVLAACAGASGLGMLLIAALIGAGYLMRHIQDIKKIPEALILLITGYCGYFFGLLGELRDQSAGFYLLISTILIPVITDIGAYCIGKSVGKHKMAPIISPKKTWEGSIGGSVAAVIVLSLAAYVLQHFGVLAVQLRPFLLYLLIGSVLAQIGDLTFSTVKRIAGIKDYGTLIPGHGGILDRFDSLLLVIPFAVCVEEYVGPMFMLT